MTQHELLQAGRSGQNLGIIYKVTWVGLVVNLLLAAAKLAAGWLANSRALAADGVHSVTDLATDAAVLVGAKFWSAPADANHPHGHGRIETLVTAFIGLTLAAAGVGLGIDAVKAFDKPVERPGLAALVVALASIVSKELVYQWTRRQGRKAHSRAVEANAWHHRSDALSSIPAAVAVAAAMISPRLAFVDAVGALVVCAFILHAAWSITMPALAELVDHGADGRQLERIKLEAMQVDGVLEVHALRSRSLGQGLQVDMHVLVDPGLSVERGHAITETLRRRLMERIPELADVITHLEPYEQH